jgi:hypothetical protein
MPPGVIRSLTWMARTDQVAARAAAAVSGIHLGPELGTVLCVAEVVVARRVFVLPFERDRRHDQVDAIGLHGRGLGDAIVVDEAEALARGLATLAADRAHQTVRQRRAAQAVFADQRRHDGGLLFMPPPLLFEPGADFALSLGIDDVDLDGVRLQESLDAVTGLDEVVEFVADAEKDRLVAVILKIAA